MASLSPPVDHEPHPKVEDRFIVKPRFGRTIVRFLNADGHIDVAHKMGLISLKTELVREWTEQRKTTRENMETDEVEEVTSYIRWAIVKVTATIRGPDGTPIECDGISCCNDLDKFVKQSGFEVSVAETRAMKRALANACNITEKYISPTATSPTRETVDVPLVDDDEEDKKPQLPQEVLRRPDVSPPIEGMKVRASPGEQFDV